MSPEHAKREIAALILALSFGCGELEQQETDSLLGSTEDVASFDRALDGGLSDLPVMVAIYEAPGCQMKFSK